jgi:hypothetical protein
VTSTTALLSDAVTLWRGDPLQDLHHVCSPDLAVGIDHVRIRHVSHLLALSELRLVADDAAASFALADRAVAGTVRRPWPRRPRRCLGAAAQPRSRRRISGLARR